MPPRFQLISRLTRSRVSDACAVDPDEILNPTFFKHERNRQLVERVAFEKRPELLIHQFERSVFCVVLNFDYHHVLLKRPPSDFRGRRACYRGSEWEEDSDGGLCKVGKFVEIERVQTKARNMVEDRA